MRGEFSPSPQPGHRVMGGMGGDLFFFAVSFLKHNEMGSVAPNGMMRYTRMAKNPEDYVFGFGKFKGYSLSEIAADRQGMEYILWMNKKTISDLESAFELWWNTHQFLKKYFDLKIQRMRSESDNLQWMVDEHFDDGE